ncbi:hypothetical protein PBS_39870 [Paraburkholderia sp. 2C]
MREAWMRLGARKGTPKATPNGTPKGMPRFSLRFRRGQCRVALCRDGVAVLRTDGGRGDGARALASSGAGMASSTAGSAASAGAGAIALRQAAALSSNLAERSLRGIASEATPEQLAAAIGAALDEAGGAGLPIHATFGDELVRYFIVTPPPNGTRLQDLRTAAEVRFQMLYGEPVAAWHLVADWHAAAPFLACAVPLRWHAALQLAARARRSSLVSTLPNFVGAWNRWRRRVAGDAWLATLHDGALTLGVIDGAGRRARLAAVRTLKLSEEAPPLAWLHEQLARTALLDNVRAPKVLHVYGQLPRSWQQAQRPGAAGNGSAGAHASANAANAVNAVNAADTVIEVRACTAARAAFAAPEGAHATWSAAAQLVAQLVSSSRGSAAR